MTLTTKATIVRHCRTAELTASLLRQPGFHRLGQTERERIAHLLEFLADVSRGRYQLADELTATPMELDAVHEDDDGNGDLFGMPVV